MFSPVFELETGWVLISLWYLPIPHGKASPSPSFWMVYTTAVCKWNQLVWGLGLEKVIAANGISPPETIEVALAEWVFSCWQVSLCPSPSLKSQTRTAIDISWHFKETWLKQNNLPAIKISAFFYSSWLLHWPLLTNHTYCARESTNSASTIVLAYITCCYIVHFRCGIM